MRILDSRPIKDRPEQIDLLYHNAPLALAGTALIGGLFAVALFLSRQPVGLVQAWFACILVLGLAGGVNHLLYRRAGRVAAEASKWRFSYALLLALTGLCWGAVGPLFSLGAEPRVQILTVVALFSALGAWMPALVAFPAAFWSFLLPSAGSLVLMQSGDGSAASLLGAVVIIVFLGAAGLSVRRIANALAQTYELVEENSALAYRVEGANTRLKQQDQRNEDTAKQLKAAKDAVEAANVAKSEFLATVSHEVRTPLNGILPILDMLNDTQLDPEQRSYLNTAIESSHHLLSIIDSILDYSKIEAGKLEVESIEVNLRELMASVVELMQSAAESRGLYLRSLVARDVPQRVRGDPIRLRQILTNLVSNAIKFTERGGVSVELTLRDATRTEVNLMFAVKDTGIGLSEQAASELFRPFHQADASTTRVHGGSGLGLAISKRLVEMMSGRIGVKSEPSKGSIFWFRVSLRRSARDVPAARRDVRNVRVLVACDEGEDYAALKRFLETWGMTQERVEGLEKAVSMLESSYSVGASWGYELLIVDAAANPSVMIADLARRIRAERAFRNVRLLLLDSDPNLSATLGEAGIEDVVSKPVRSAELRRKVYRLLDVDEGREPGEKHKDLSRFRPSFTLYGDGAKTPKIPEERPRPSPDQAARSSRPLRGYVLLVEDNPVNLQVARKLILRLGLNCAVATDGEQALIAMRKVAFDAVLMDCQMPKVDGYEATRRFRLAEMETGSARLPIIAMTANVMVGDREKCLDAGMDDYIGKPINLAGLGAVLDKWLPGGRGAPAAQDDQTSAEPPVKPEPAEATLDLDVLRELFDVMEGEFTDLIGTFLESAPGLLAEIAAAAKADNVEGMVVPAHSLKSSAANIGASRLSERVKAVELSARSGDLPGSQALAAEIPEAYRSAAAELGAIRERGAL